MRKFPNLIPSRLRLAISQMSNDQRKAIRLPHVGVKEITRGNKLLRMYGLKYELIHENRDIPIRLKHWNKVVSHV